MEIPEARNPRRDGDAEIRERHGTTTTARRKTLRSLVAVAALALVATTFVATNPATADPQAVDCDAQFGLVPSGTVTPDQDRDQMICQVGFDKPELGPWLEDPNRPPNVTTDATERLWWDNCGHPVRRGAMGGLWANYDDGTGTGAIGYGTGDNLEVDGWEYTPIDLLEMDDGTPVTTTDEWWNERRPEIVADAQAELYGKIPDRSLWPAITWELGAPVTGTEAGAAYVERTVTGNLDTSSYPQVRNVPRIFGTLRVPQASFEAGTEVPVVVTFGTSLTNWADLAPQGYGIFAFQNAQLQPDSGGANLSSYLIGLINKGQWRSPDDWGALAAWSWGISRVIDFFEQPTGFVGVDADRIGVQGHSRYGKATIVAAAFDPRVKAAYTSSSGSLGAHMNRRHYGQDLENDGDYANNAGESREYHWMAGNYFQWMGPLVDDPEYPGVGLASNGTYKPRRVELMSVDGHSMVALAAPRVVFITGGNENDAWADPRGMYLAGANATPVYNLLGVDGLVVPPETVFTSGACESFGGTPPFDQAFGDGFIGFRRQDAGHTATPGWPSFVQASRKILDFAPFSNALHVEAGTTATSEVWTVDGLTGPTPISVVSGEYKVGETWSSAPGVIEDGTAIQVRHTTSCSADAPVVTTLKVGDATYTFTSITAADSNCGETALPDLTIAAGTRCAAGKALVTVQAQNGEDVPVALTAESAFATKSFPQVLPGKSAFHAFTTRAANLPGGIVTVTATATIAGQPVTETTDVHYDAASCG